MAKYISREEFIFKNLKKKNSTAIAAGYIREARFNGGRICDDGYPDSRFKATYCLHFEEIRKLISRLRREYEYEYPCDNHIRNIKKFWSRR